jgi:hypothetical protein
VQKMLHIGILLVTVCGGIFGSVFAMAQEETTVRETELTACIGPSEYAGVVEDAKEKLLATVKRDAMSHFYGEIVTATTTVENFVLTRDEVTTAMQGLVRIAPSPEFYNSATGLNEICIRARAFVTASDLELFTLQPVRAERVCDSGIGTASQRREEVEKQLRTNALINFDGQLANADEERRLALLKEVRFTGAGFQPDTGDYCAGVTGRVMPFEVYALLGVAPPPTDIFSATSTPIIPLLIVSFLPAGPVPEGSIVTIRGTGPDRVQIEVISNGSMLGTTYTNGGGAWSFSAPFNISGYYRLTTRMYLADGTVRPGSGDITIRVAAPTPAPDGTNSPTPTVTVTATATFPPLSINTPKPTDIPMRPMPTRTAVTSTPTPRPVAPAASYPAVTLIEPTNSAAITDSPVILRWQSVNNLRQGDYYLLVISHTKGASWIITSATEYPFGIKNFAALQAADGFQWFVGVCAAAETGDFPVNRCNGDLRASSEKWTFRWVDGDGNGRGNGAESPIFSPPPTPPD